jgi:hypothetical protein
VAEHRRSSAGALVKTHTKYYVPLGRLVPAKAGRQQPG